MKKKLPKFVALNILLSGFFLLVTFSGQLSFARDSRHILTVDHYVRHISTVPAIEGEEVQLYVQEKVLAGVAKTFRSTSGTGKVVLFVHGGTFPSPPGFDVPYEDYSWMAYLAQAGFDVFAMDMTGYGRSSRPQPMDDPCNLIPDDQVIIGISPCSPSYPFLLTTSESEWDDIDRVVDYIRSIRGVEKVSLIGWSYGGPRFGGYAALYPEKIDKLILLAPVYIPVLPDDPPIPVPSSGVPMRVMPRIVWTAIWNMMVQCENQFDAEIRDVIWEMLMESDPGGATWGPGVVRAPTVTQWGWNSNLAAQVKAPTLLISGELDILVPPSAVQILYDNLGTQRKVFMTIGCGSHFVLYESQHEILFKASRDWLLHGSIHGIKRGSVRVDSEGHFDKF